MKRFFILICATLVFACEQENKLPEDGLFVGIFSVSYSNPSFTDSDTTSIVFKKNQYKGSGTVRRIPAGGEGTYRMNGSKIIFDNINYWTADFDWNTILNGEYQYMYEGDKLVIWKDVGTTNKVRYQYSLTKK